MDEENEKGWELNFEMETGFAILGAADQRPRSKLLYRGLRVLDPATGDGEPLGDHTACHSIGVLQGRAW
jgi:hypothetical protein